MWRQEKERGKKRTLLLCYNYYYYYHRFLSNFVESYCCAYLIFTTFITTRLTWSKQFVDCCLMLMQRGYTIFCYSGYSVLLLPWTEQGRLDASLSSRKPFVETVWERWLSLLPTTSCICRKNVPTQTQDRNLSDSWANGRFNLSSKPAVGCQC